LAAHVRATITPDEARYIHDERYNVYLALDLDDADILFVLGSRAIANGATDIEAFTEGYIRALADGPSDHHLANESFIKGYEAARSALRLSQHAGESHASPSPAQQA
jgi:hypothetical protein